MVTDDVMLNILFRLPLKTLLTAKCVCKLWNQMISDPLFVSNYSRQNLQHNVSGFFLQKLLLVELYPKLEFIACGELPRSAPEPSLSFIQDVSGVCIRDSCNGLLLCSSSRCHEEHRNYYICKPTTKQCQLLPSPKCETVKGMNLVYDPSLSPHYKIITICDSQLSDYLLQIKIYESASGSWRDSKNPHFFHFDLLFDQGVLWNNALHWVGEGDASLRFDNEQERTFTMPMPPIPEERTERRLAYFGESGGHLYLVEVYGPETIIFDVMEMRSYSCGWFVKYHVDLRQLTVNFPHMVRHNVEPIHRYMFSFLHIIDRQVGDEDESSMVIHIPGNILTYNFKDGAIKDLHIKTVDKRLGLWYSWKGVYPFINTLCYI